MFLVNRSDSPEELAIDLHGFEVNKIIEHIQLRDDNTKNTNNKNTTSIKAVMGRRLSSDAGRRAIRILMLRPTF